MNISCTLVPCVLIVIGCKEAGPPTWMEGTEDGIVFISKRNGGSQLLLADTRGKSLECIGDLVPPKQDLAQTAAAWGSPIIVTTLGGWSDYRDILIVRVDTGVVRNLTEGRLSFCNNPKLAPDGRRIAFHSTLENNLDVFCVNADGSGLTRLTLDPAHDMYPEWSPDGSQILFTSQRGGGNSVYLMRSDGGDQHRVTPSGLNVVDACWSPDCARIGFSADGGVHTIRTDGSDLQRLTGGSSWDVHPAWSPVGDRIAFVSKRTSQMAHNVMARERAPDENWISVMKSDGTELKSIAHSQQIGHVSQSGPLHWSRGGKLLVVETCRWNERWGSPEDPEVDFEVYVIDAAGRGAWNLSRHAGYDGDPTWYVADRKAAGVSP